MVNILPQFSCSVLISLKGCMKKMEMTLYTGYRYKWDLDYMNSYIESFSMMFVWMQLFLKEIRVLPTP